VSNSRRTVGVFCPTFLKPEMLHVYRQVTNLRRYVPAVLTFKREHAERFPAKHLTLVRRSPARELQRFLHRRILHRPQTALASEVRSLIGGLQQNECSLLHIYFGNNGVFWLPYLRRAALPTVVSFHGADATMQASSAETRALLEMSQLSTLILARTQSLANALLIKGVPAERIRLHRAGIPLDDFPVVPRRDPKESRWRVIQACRLVEKKGIPTTLDAFANFRRAQPNAILTIAGDGPLRGHFADHARRLGLGESVRFAGLLTTLELARLYQQSDIFVHPSETGADGNQEGIPNSLLEALASGLPAITTRHGGIGEAIEDGVSGFLIPERDPYQLSARLLELSKNSQLRNSIGMAGAEVVRSRFDLPSQIDILEGLYDEAIERFALSPSRGAGGPSPEIKNGPYQ
jgi:colanic acid/amylovoran biosynthesis glycosyltransferase